MNLTSLGHSAFLLEMATHDGRRVRILGDPWLSDHVIGDLMGRFPRIRLNFSKLPPIDGIFLSHSHTDHLDPYSLIELWKHLPQPPSLLLPQSIAYLEHLLRENLPGSEVVRLEDDQPVNFRGLSITAYLNVAAQPTNEDDVMLLVVTNDDEVFLNESDAMFPLDDDDARAAMSQILGDPEKKTACFLTTKNELEATMASVGARSAEERRQRVETDRLKTLDSIDSMYTPIPGTPNDLWANPRLVRLVGGQGICFPQQVDPAWNRVLFPIRVRDRVHMEQEVANAHGSQHTVREFVPGRTYRMDGVEISEEKACWLEALDSEEDRDFDGSLEKLEDFPDAPLRDEDRDAPRQGARILEALNQRFLPHLIGLRSPPIEHLLRSRGDRYSIRVRFGRCTAFVERDYAIRFSRLRFGEEDPQGTADEWYWANDLDDYLDGRCDDFSTFCRHPLPGDTQRFWDTLGMPYLNNDLVEKKLAYHFERARAGSSLEDWVLAFYAFHSSP